MDIDRIDPALRSVTEKAPTLNLENGLTRRLIATLSRLAPGKKVDGVERRIIRAGSVPLRVYTPGRPTGSALLWIHGGGLVLGAAATDDGMCAETARATGAIVVSVDYRLAPRYPFPAAIEDCSAGFDWLLAHAQELGVDRARIAVGGQSAGGGLAAALVQKLHDGGVGLAAQWLFCPMLDDRTATDRSLDAVDHFVWNNRSNLVGWQSYLGDRIGVADLPPYAAAARRQDLTGFPETWIYASDAELFYEEDLRYATRLEQAGVEVTFETVHGAAHGFEAWAPDTERARRLVSDARSWLKARLV